MIVNSETKQCLNCGRSEMELPLVVLQYKGKNNWICSECLPILIHHSHELADKLVGDAES